MNSEEPSTVRTVSGWTRYEGTATAETVLCTMTAACMSCSFGYDDVILIRMGTVFYQELLARVNLCRQARNDASEREAYVSLLEDLLVLDIFMGARVVVDPDFDPHAAHLYIWDRETFALPILFVGAVVTITSGERE